MLIEERSLSKEVVKEKFLDYMPEKYKGMEVVVAPVEKVNMTLDGLSLREEGNHHNACHDGIYSEQNRGEWKERQGNMALY